MKTYYEGQGFLGLEKPYCDFETARVIVAPFYLLRSGGSCHGPLEIIKRSREVQVFGDDFKEDVFRKLGIATLDTNPRFLPSRNPLSIEQAEHQTVLMVLERKKFPLVIASENRSVCSAFSAVWGKFKKVIFLRFDSRLNFKNLQPGGTLAEDTAFWCLIKNAEKSIFAGVRSAHPEEINVLRNYRIPVKDYEDEKIKVMRMRKHFRKDKTSLRNLRVLLNGKKVYVSFHLSVMDASAIGLDTTYFEPGGFSYDDCLDIFEEIFPKLDIVGADFTGICLDAFNHPLRTPTPYIAAKLISRFIANLNI